MSRIRVIVATVLVVGIGCWLLLRKDRTAAAVEPASFGANTEDVAAHRWVHNAPRHWRALMVKR